MKDLLVEENLELRLVDEKYAEEAFAVVAENYDHLYRWMPWVNKHYTANSARAYFRESRERIRQGRGADFSIFLNDRLIGGIGLNNFDPYNRSAEIGYWLAADRQGLGIITKACRRILEYAFEELDFNRMVIRCATKNTRSRAIPERLGFQIEGVARQSEFLHGTFMDLVVYSLLREEWLDLKKI